ncbi:hypothetical protein STRDD11_00304 [Streptococcus sp. DD11]|uniref:hypothetical protein n=1 Tax=Streptococcus sp. DD11 TaxID=1777879 RepID=UPI000792F8D2|nr:hypothetical protein [Streptococcus sp. DD11]KXT85574.1 hypothetical protein STRDD11_00304 [Streptococcus sp. DD11]
MQKTKATVDEKTRDYLSRQKQLLARQKEKQKDFLKEEAAKRKAFLQRMQEGENGIRYSKWGVKAGYAVLAGGLLTSVFSPWRGLGIMAVGGLSVASNLWNIRRLQDKKRRD